MDRKLALIGGGGVRTPLLVFGVNEVADVLGARELVLYDPAPERLHMMAELGRAIVARERGQLVVRETSSIEDAIEGASFVMNSIRVGGIGGRAADEGACIKHGYSGQETTGPGGVAMALRTVPEVIEQAKLVEKYSPEAWLISFTNPAGLITQAVSDNTKAKVVGICDTPTELFHNIARALGAEPSEVDCDYVGLNHLGWVRHVTLRGEDVIDRILEDDSLLAALYSVPLFDPEMIRELRLIPTEYLYFYYERRKALANQRRQGSTRGKEILELNNELLGTLATRLRRGNSDGAIAAYEAYLNRRSGSYMKLEASAGSAFDAKGACDDVDPFRAATGYHRIAINVMTALTGARPADIVVNVKNQGAVPDLPDDDIVETSCSISEDRIVPKLVAALPDAVQGLVRTVKAYERAAINAAMECSPRKARKAMLIHPAIGEWSPSAELISELMLESVFGHDACDDVGSCAARVTDAVRRGKES